MLGVDGDDLRLINHKCESSSSAADEEEPHSSNHHHHHHHTHASFQDIVLFFGVGIATSIGQIGALSSLVYYSQIFGDEAFIYFNLAASAAWPLIAIPQALWDKKYDVRYGITTTFLFRGGVAFVLNIISVTVLAFIVDFNTVVWLIFLISIASAILFGTTAQMASFVSSCGRLHAAFTSGLLLSGIVALVVSVLTGFGRSGSDSGKILYFVIIGSIQTFCTLLFFRLILHRDGVRMSISRIDSLNGFNFAEPKAEPEEENEDETAKETLITTRPTINVRLSYKELWQRTWQCCISLSITMASIMTMCAWFTKIKSPTVILPQVLYYVRIFTDVLGRPATVCVTMTPSSLLAVATIRLLTTPLFFYVSSGNWCPEHSDIILVLLVAILAFSAGFVITICYQIAPKQLLPEEEASLTEQASLLTIFFSISGLVGVIISVILKSYL